MYWLDVDDIPKEWTLAFDEIGKWGGRYCISDRQLFIIQCLIYSLIIRSYQYDIYLIEDIFSDIKNNDIVSYKRNELFDWIERTISSLERDGKIKKVDVNANKNSTRKKD